MSGSSTPSSATTFREIPAPAHPGEPATVLFSGGSDSTLTASLYAERGFHVHLITYRHRIMRFEEKCLHSLASLREKHGDRFTHSFVNMNPLFDRLFFKPLAADLKRWGTYAMPMCCGSCKLAMHVCTIVYNRRHGIRLAADGSNIELSELFPEQMPAVLALYGELYARYGLSHATPVFDVRRSDHELFARGVTKRRDYKQQVIVYSNQHSCFAGTLLHAYTLGLAVPLFGRSSEPETAERYVRVKIDEVVIPYLDEELSACPAVDSPNSA